jgi:hypothetical protein
MSLVGQSVSEPDTAKRIEDIRKVMLDSMSDSLNGRVGGQKVWDKLKSASNIQSHWYLRMDLMKLVSSHCGETMAVDALHVVTKSFCRVLFHSQMPKPTRFQR